MQLGRRGGMLGEESPEHLPDRDLPLDAAVDRDVHEDRQALRRGEPLRSDQLADILDDVIGEAARHMGEQRRMSALPQRRLRAGGGLDGGKQRHDGEGRPGELVQHRGGGDLAAGHRGSPAQHRPGR